MGRAICLLLKRMEILEDNGLNSLTEAIHSYLHDTDAHAALCEKHNTTAAVHTRGSSLQLYRLFKTDAVTAKQVHQASKELPDWSESIYWKKGGTLAGLWEKQRRDVESHTTERNGLFPILTHGIAWEGLPVLIHAYKYETEPTMKLELIMGQYESPVPELSLHIILSLLRCHEFIVPEYIANALPPYERHETKFKTIGEYLTETMPKELYTTQCLQRMSCHASNGVGSRDILREHSELASHSLVHAKA